MSNKVTECDICTTGHEVRMRRWICYSCTMSARGLREPRVRHVNHKHYDIVQMACMMLPYMGISQPDRLYIGPMIS